MSVSVGTSVTIGLERLLSSGRLRGRRVGVVANPASVDSAFRSAVERLATAPGVTLAAIFGPQHGYRSDVQDNMIESGHAHDALHGIPVYSLYSETREPTAEMLRGLDALVIDLQDIGARIYTYMYTMANCLRAGKRHGVPVIVCDRPNPIGGVDVEGPVLVEGYESFVGQFPIPMRHGMTIGELAKLFNDHFGIGTTLEIVPMEGWSREQYWDETGHPWVMTSPNIPTLDSAIVFPGTVLFEGTMLSEGRGTTRPFELVGAPWIDGERFAARMNAQGHGGVHFRGIGFEPTFQKHARIPCGGCQIHVTDRRAFEPVAVGVSLLCEFYASDPAAFTWRPPPYEYEHEKLPFDILAGSSELRGQIESQAPLRDIVQSWQAPLETFGRVRERFLMY
jgi:uncharacterized protein YbbC (DUF1343 family)